MLSRPAFGQADAGAPPNDPTRIALTPVVPEASENLPAGARQVLLNRLLQLANSNGYAGSASNGQFLLAANPVIVDKKVAGTAPPKIWVEMEMTLFIADPETKTILSTASVPLKGVGATDTEACIEAFKTFSVSKKEVRAFAEEGRKEIVAFYDKRCDFLLKRADMLTGTQNATAALELLLRVPEVSEKCYDAALAKIREVFPIAAEQQCRTLLQAAGAAWAKSPDRNGAEKAAGYLSLLPLQAGCRSEADALLKEIKAKMQELEGWDRQQYRDDLDLARRYIAAMRDIGVAYGQGQPDTQVLVKGWLW